MSNLILARRKKILNLKRKLIYPLKKNKCTRILDCNSETGAQSFLFDYFRTFALIKSWQECDPFLSEKTYFPSCATYYKLSSINDLYTTLPLLYLAFWYFQFSSVIIFRETKYATIQTYIYHIQS